MLKTSKSHLISLTIILCTIALSNSLNFLFISSEIKDNCITPHVSWTIGGATIDETGNGDYTWEEAVLEEWCYGSGTKTDPYVIHNSNTYSYFNFEIKHSTPFFIIRDCYLASGLMLYNTTNGLIYDNQFRTTGPGINIFYSSNNTIRNNSILPDSGPVYPDPGIILSTESSNNRIMENTISGFKWGIRIFESNNNLIFNNNITLTYKALDMDLASNNVIAENDLSFNGNGIFLYEKGNYNNTFSNNRFINNTNRALHLSSSASGNFFYDNLFENTGNLSVFIDHNANDNLFYNNTFKSNNIHVIDHSFQSKWNNSEYGNYWDNYTGLDYNDDGIGDIPYIINASSSVQDFLPIWEDGDDPTPPILNLINPSDNQFLGIKTPTYELDTKSLYIDKMWYNLNRTMINHTITSFSGIFNSGQWSSFNSGEISIVFYANDSLGNIGSVNITIEKDNILPLVFIHEPIDDQRFSRLPKYSLSVIEENPYSIWYTLDNGANNYSTAEVNGTISQDAWSRVPAGNLTIEFYVSDVGGNLGYVAVEIIKEIPEQPLIHGYNFLLIFPILLLSILGVVLLTNKKTKP